MKKVRILFLVLMCLMASCHLNDKDKPIVELIISDFETEFKVGEVATFEAKLMNHRQTEVTIEHGFPLITMYTYPKGSKPETGTESLALSATIAPNDSITKTLSVSFDEAGTYMLDVYCVFSIDDTNYHFDPDDIEIKVLDK